MRPLALACLAALFAACGGNPSSPGGGSHDGGPSADAGGGDAGPGGDGGGDAGPVVHGSCDGGCALIRVMTGNLTSGNLQSYDPGEGIRIFQGLQPDVALVQETNYGTNSDADIRRFVDLAFGASFSYFRETGAQLPNAVVSRFPILQSGHWIDSSVSNRSFSWAEIDIPGPANLWAVSVHLLTSSSSSRAAEAQQLAGYIQQNVPAGDFVVVGGDFNTGSRTETAIANLAAVATDASPYPVDEQGNENTNSSRAKPYDWVATDPALATCEVPVVIGAHSFPAGLVFDSRVYTPLADVPPVLQGDSAAANMQHMGVVREFAVPLQ